MFNSMRRKFLIPAVLLLVILLIPQTVVFGEEPEHSLQFFYNNVCASCHEEDNFYDLFNRCVTSEEKKTITYEIRTYNLFLDADEAVYEKLLEESGKEKADYTLPVLVIDGQWISGYEEMERRLHGVLFGEEIEESPSVSPGSSEEEMISPAAEEKDITAFLADAGDSDQALLLFTTYSCEECEEAREFLSRLQEEEDFLMDECNIVEGDNVTAFKNCLSVWGYPQEEGKVPAVFTGKEALFGANEIKEKLPAILEEGQADAKELETRLSKSLNAGEEDGSGPSLLAILGAGLLSGFNPCSISMLLMLFSILLTSHSSVLKNGLVYLAGKYAVYLGLGCGIYFAASQINENLLSRYSRVVDWIIVALFLVAALLNFLDFLNVRKEQYGKVRMQLPQKLRRFNHKLIRHAQGAEGVFLTLLVLGLGIAVSVGEFFCTGQIYMASILYLLRSGGSLARNLLALLLYVTAMSIPSAVIVVIIHLTKGTGKVSQFMLDHLAGIKLLNTGLFILYAIYFILR